jgi:hypothetical protein
MSIDIKEMKKEIPGRGVFVLWLLAYVSILSYARFSYFHGQLYTSLYKWLVNPSLFPHDLAMRDSIYVKSSVFFKLIAWIGPPAVTPLFFFLIYLAVSFAVALSFYFLGKTISGGRREAGILTLCLLMIGYQPLLGADVCIAYPHQFSPSHIATLFLIMALVASFKKRWFLTCSLLAFDVWIQMRNSLNFILAYVPVLFKFLKKRRDIIAIILLIIIVAPFVFNRMPKDIFETKLDHAMLLEYQNTIIKDNYESYILDIAAMRWVNFLLMFILGFYTIKFVENDSYRRMIRLFHLGVCAILMSSVAVSLLHVFNDKIYLGELLLTGASRSVIVIGSIWMVTFALMFLKIFPRDPAAHSEAGRTAAWIALFMGFSLMPSISFKTGRVFSIAAIVLAFILAWFLAYSFSKRSVRAVLTNRTYLAMIISLSIATLLAGRTFFKAKNEQHPFFPFQTHYYNSGLYDIQLWAKNNTPIHAVFMNLSDSIADDTFRNFSERGSYYNKRVVLDILGNPKYYPEWRQRRDAYIKTKKLLEAGIGGDDIRRLLKGENIQYIITDRDVNAGLELAYENNRYRIFRVNNLPS